MRLIYISLFLLIGLNSFSQSTFNGVEEKALRILQAESFHIGDITVGEYMKDLSQNHPDHSFSWIVETTKDSSYYLLSIRRDEKGFAYWEVNIRTGLIQYVNNSKKLCEKYALNYDDLLGVYTNQIINYVDEDIIDASVSINPASSGIVFVKRDKGPEKDPNEFMMGRELMERPNIPERMKKGGKVVVKIKLNEIGEVIHAEFVPKGSTTLEGKLITFAIKHAFDAKYDQTEIEGTQIGQIVFDFKKENE